MNEAVNSILSDVFDEAVLAKSVPPDAEETR
jgi:hypothetical protein